MCVCVCVCVHATTAVCVCKPVLNFDTDGFIMQGLWQARAFPFDGRCRSGVTSHKVDTSGRVVSPGFTGFNNFVK